MDKSDIFFGFSFRHHGRHSGFAGLASAMNREIVVDASPPWPAWIPHALEWRLTWRWLYCAEWRIRRFYRESDPRVIHYFFPENTMYRAHEWKRGHALVATCHQPAERLREPRVNDPRFERFMKGLRACDILVIQSMNEIHGYRELFPDQRIEYVPHGVDTGYFRPGNRLPENPRPRILTIGNWLRDYDTWAAAVRILHDRGCKAEFVVIANRDTCERAARSLHGSGARATFLSSISDDDLLNEYRRADLLFLPLAGAMANNALLEGLAAGIPLVVTDLEATRLYGGDAAVYVPGGDAETAADAAAGLLADPGRSADLRRSARERAVREFSWTAVAARYRALYEDVRNR